MATAAFERVDAKHDGLVTRAELSSFVRGEPTMSMTHPAHEVQPLPSTRIQRAEGSIVRSAASAAAPVALDALPAVVRASSTSAPNVSHGMLSGSMVASAPFPQVSLQPRVIPMAQASVIFGEVQTLPAAATQAAYLESEPAPAHPEVLQMPSTKVIDIKPQVVGVKPQVIQSLTASIAKQELQDQTEIERSIYMRSMQETHTLQIRMLEELIEQKVNKALDIVTMVSNQADDRFAHSEAYSLELKVALQDMRRDLDVLNARFLEFADIQALRENGGDRGEVLAALGGIHSDIEAMRHQHRTALSAIQAQKEQHQHLQSLHDDLRQRLDQPHHRLDPQAPGERQPGELQLQGRLSDLHDELSLLAAQQQSQGSQLQELEAQVVQHLQGLKEQQQNEALLLRQDLEATLAANGHGEGILDLRRKYEDVSRAVEVALRELPPERQAAPPLGLEALEAEREERAQGLGELAAALQAERQERLQAFEAMELHQQRTAEETFGAVNAAVNSAADDLRAELRALADQMLRQGPDRAELESLVARAVRPDRDARAELTQFLEAERGGRVQDLENERCARVRETTDLRAAVQRLSERVAELPDPFVDVSELVSQEVGRCLLEHREGVERRLDEVAQQAAAAQYLGAEAAARDVPTQERSELSNLSAALERAVDDLARLEASLAQANERACSLSEQQIDAERRISDLDALVQTMGRDQASHASAVRQANERAFSLSDRHSDAERRLGDLDAMVQTLGRDHASHASAARSLSEQHRHVERRIGDLDALVQSLGHEHASHTSAVREEMEDLRGVVQRQQEPVHDGAASSSTLASLREEIEVLRGITNQMGSSEMQVSGEVAALRGEFLALRTRFDALAAREEMGDLHGQDPVHDGAVSSSTLASLREEIEVLRGITNQTGSSEMQVSGEVAALRGEFLALRTRVDGLAAREAVPHSSTDSAVQPNFDALAAAVEAETLKRCEAVADINACMKREAAEVSSRIELMWRDLQEAVNLESQSRNVEMETLHASRSMKVEDVAAGSGTNSDVVQAAERSLEFAQALQGEIHELVTRERLERDAALGVERDARLREGSALRSELGQVVERERADRTAQSSELRTDLLRAVARERDERIAEGSEQRAEMAKMVREWHGRLLAERAATLEEREETPPASAEPGHGTDSLGFVSRFFRKSRTPSADAETYAGVSSF